MEKILYFDCFAGISGDMTIGALLDLGIEHKTFLAELDKLNIKGYSIEIGRGDKNGISGTDFNVILDHHHHHGDDHDHDGDHHHHDHRNLYDINKIIEESSLKDSVKELSKKIFGIVAQAEAKIHGKSLEEVHFHEVGAMDSIVDIVGTAICVDLLGIDKIYSAPLQVGSGFVECAHGIIPVPAPATMEILKGLPIYNNGIKKELVTPTGAAIIKALASEYGDIPTMELEGVGYGLGKRNLKIPNLLRVFMGVKKNLG